MRCTSSGHPPVNPPDASVPNSDRRPDGQHVDHWVLCAEERAKGFVRPVRDSYEHIGRPAPKNPLFDLTDEQKAMFGDLDYVKFEKYRDRPGPIGRYWTQAELDKVGKGCGTVTSMPQAIAETYARSPGYYGSTFCCGCRDYFPVGRDGEFVWKNSDERVGT
jgi:hypothetical protein